MILQKLEVVLWVRQKRPVIVNVIVIVFVNVIYIVIVNVIKIFSLIFCGSVR